MDYMRISIDYDNTYTTDPLLWNWFAQEAMARGHEVYCVSYRQEKDMDEPRATIGRLIVVGNCYGTGGQQKKEFMSKKGIAIDIWVDDMPDTIVGHVNWGVF